ncbi:alpha-xylosidase [Vibrio sp. HA2012]|uniref:alpha-xylosidase n=1 Tax=Vibrio sp. HA2012 TaxID=1971595 RepID=UPI000C2BA0E8|nr:alpha-xylosidase [Vibrio sp. HA2012]PJC85607.1 alpha-xylosidase [Vibrio sp. HA2012]
MKISDGNWLIQENLNLISPVHTFEYQIASSNEIVIYVSPIDGKIRENQIGSPLFTITLTAPIANVIGVRYEHFKGKRNKKPHFELAKYDIEFEVTDSEDVLIVKNGNLEAHIAKNIWGITFYRDGVEVTKSTAKSSGYAVDKQAGKNYFFERLDLGVGELVYGLGERFTALVKNGQQVETWNKDGGTSTEQAYKNIPFYITNKGYGVFVDHPENVSFEIASEKVSKVQFSVEGEYLSYYVIDGPTGKDVLNNYTQISGRPGLPPAWTFGLWLTTSFTTNYDEATVNSFIDGMIERDLPLHVFHFDCFWMKPYQWCDFQWDDKTFPDPEAMLTRLKAKGLKICVWINSYLGQKSPLFEEAAQKGYLLKNLTGDVWQWDHWQAGMGIVDFTNPEACQWYESHLERLIDMGVDSFKTDFGERIPTDVQWFNGACPQKMHNYYTFLYNELVYRVLERKLGQYQAALFARSATAGSQQFPVHWGGDCYATYESMAESLRGGLSLGLSGFGFWSHDIGGFENTAPAHLYKRWCAFGLLSSHSRLHGSKSYRVPWAYDEESCDVVRSFTKLKANLMPYLYSMAHQAKETGIPMMRAMWLEFENDLTTHTLDLQYMLGDSLLVAPVFSEKGDVSYYLPEGEWTHLLTGKVVKGGKWHKETYDFMSLPLYVRPNTLLASSINQTEVDYDFIANAQFHLYQLSEGCTAHSKIINSDNKKEVNVCVTRNLTELEVTIEGEIKNLTLYLHGLKPSSLSIPGIIQGDRVSLESITKAEICRFQINLEA